MALKPFIKLQVPRPVDRPELPADLAAFYAEHEGIGLEYGWDDDVVIRSCKLDEVERVGWKGVDSVADVPEGWERFTALRIASGMFFEEIVYVLDAPSCPPGSVLAIGGDLLGLGGAGPYALDCSLVLASTFPAWLAHLERWGWAEPAIAAAWEFTEQERQESYRYYLALNPAARR